MKNAATRKWMPDGRQMSGVDFKFRGGKRKTGQRISIIFKLLASTASKTSTYRPIFTVESHKNINFTSLLNTSRRRLVASRGSC
jgi:hypothetical protein